MTGAQPGRGDTARVAGTGGLFLAARGAGEVWCPQSSTTAPREASHLNPSASAPAPWPGLAHLSMPHGLAPALAMAGHRGHRAHPTGPAKDACGGTPGFWGRQGCAHGCRMGVCQRGAGLGLQAARQSRAAAMWPVCVWAAGRVGEKEGEEAAEAAAPLISSFLNTFKPWC